MTAVDEQQSATAKKNTPLNLKDFLDGLLEEGYIDQEEYALAVAEQHAAQHREKHILQFIADLNLNNKRNEGRALDIETLTSALSKQCGQDYFRIDPLKIDVAMVTQVMDYKFSQRHQILAVDETPTEVVITSAEPYLNDWESVLEHTSQKQIKRVVSNPIEIKRLATEFYSLSKSVQGATAGGAQKKGIGNLEQMLELGNIKEPEANDQHIVNVVDWLLQYAFEQRASDIHIEPRREKGNIRFRIDGVLYTVYALPMQALAAVTSRLKILGRMNVAEKRKPQDGRIKTKSPNGEEVELRLSTLPTAFGEKLVMRIFDPGVLLKPFEELGLYSIAIMAFKYARSFSSPICVVLLPNLHERYGETGDTRQLRGYMTKAAVFFSNTIPLLIAACWFGVPYLVNRVIPAKYREKHLEGFAQFRETGQGAVIGNVMEMTALRKDGEEFSVELAVSSMKMGGRWKERLLMKTNRR